MRIPDTYDFGHALPSNVAQREMRRHERLLWAERAAKGSALRRGARGAVIGVFFTAFSVFWMAFAFIITGSARSDDDIVFRFFPWFGLPFLATGVLMIVGPIWGIGSPRPIYALTNERFLVFSGRRGQNVRSYDLVEMTGLQRVERNDGSGDITFGQPGSNARNGIYGVPGVRRVVADIERARVRALDLARDEARDADRGAS